jgi:hypothetical protein
VGRLSLHRLSRWQQVDLQSKSGQPLARYFPEVVMLAETQSKAVCDRRRDCRAGEGKFSFDDLLMRIHPAASRSKSFRRKPRQS